MANRYAVANGNWSATATWNGGTLPTAADDVFANNFTVTIDQNVTALSLRTTADTGINAGGRFDLNSGFNVTADIRAGGTGSNQACLYVTFNSPTSATITGNIFGSTATASDIFGIWHVGSGSITIQGTVNSGSGTSGSRRYGVYNQSIGSITINGDVYANTTGNGASNFNGVVNAATGSITLNGNAYGSTTSENRAIQFIGGGTYTQTGNIIGSLATANGTNNVVEITSATVNITGNIDSALNGRGIQIGGNSNFTLTGTLTNRGTGNNFGNALYTLSTASGTINGNLIGSSTSIGGNNSVIFHQSTGLLTINGDLIRQGSGGNVIWMANTNNNVVINGNLSGAAGSSLGNVIRLQAANGNLVINGNVNPMPTSGVAIEVQSSCTIIINGNVVGGSGTSQTITQTSGSLPSFSLTINGNVTAGATQPAVDVRSGTLTIKRVIGNAFGVGSTGVNQVFAAVVTSPALLVVQELEFGSLGAFPVSPYCRLQLTPNSVAVFRDSSGNQVTLVNPSSVVTPPAVTDVRSGVVYNAGNLTGTCAVPAASSVAAGVAVGNTVGTAVLTQANVWDYAISSASSVAGSVGEKLKKTAIPADIIALG